VKSPAISAEYSDALRSGDVDAWREAWIRQPRRRSRCRGTHPDAASDTADVFVPCACSYCAGADVNFSIWSGATALMRAAYDYEKVKRYNMGQGNARSGIGEYGFDARGTPVEHACAVELLLTHGADAKATTSSERAL